MLKQKDVRVLDISTSISCPFSGRTTSSRASGSAVTCCPGSVWVTPISGGPSGHRCFWSCGGRCDRLPLALSCFGVAWAKTGLTLATMAAERGLAVRPRWTVSQPSASFLPANTLLTPLTGEKNKIKWRRIKPFLSLLRIVKGKFSESFLTRFLSRGCGWLTWNGLSALYSVCPAGTCVGEPSCSQRWRRTSDQVHTHI